MVLLVTSVHFFSSKYNTKQRRPDGKLLGVPQFSFAHPCTNGRRTSLIVLPLMLPVSGTNCPMMFVLHPLLPPSGRKVFSPYFLTCCCFYGDDHCYAHELMNFNMVHGCCMLVFALTAEINARNNNRTEVSHN